MNPAQKGRARPAPLMIAAGLYDAIQVTAISKALDPTGNSSLNTHREPPKRTFTDPDGASVVFVCYSAELLRLWLTYLFYSDAWATSQIVTRTVTSKSNANAQVSNKAKRERVYRPPTVDMLRQYSGLYPEVSIEKLSIIAQIIKETLIDIGPVNIRLDHAGIIPHGGLPSIERVATAANLTKPSRLFAVGYRKVSLSEGDTIAWDNFSESETARIQYLISTVKGTQISDSALRSLSEKDRENYNLQTMAEMFSLMSASSKVAVSNSTQLAIVAPSSNSSFNPALAQSQIIALNAKKVKPKGVSVQRRYTTMISIYEKLTNCNLDPKAERAGKTLIMRMNSIEWMNRILASYPFARFRHDVNTNSPVQIEWGPDQRSIQQGTVPQIQYSQSGPFPNVVQRPQYVPPQQIQPAQSLYAPAPQISQPQYVPPQQIQPAQSLYAPLAPPTQLQYTLPQQTQTTQGSHVFPAPPTQSPYVLPQQVQSQYIPPRVQNPNDDLSNILDSVKMNNVVANDEDEEDEIPDE